MHDVPSPQLLDELVGLSEGFAGSDLEWVVHQIASAAFGRIRRSRREKVIKAKFASVKSFSRTYPEQVTAIRAWGKERAMPAGRAERVSFIPPVPVPD